MEYVKGLDLSGISSITETTPNGTTLLSGVSYFDGTTELGTFDVNLVDKNSIRETYPRGNDAGDFITVNQASGGYTEVQVIFNGIAPLVKITEQSTLTNIQSGFPDQWTLDAASGSWTVDDPGDIDISATVGGNTVEWTYPKDNIIGNQLDWSISSTQTMSSLNIRFEHIGGAGINGNAINVSTAVPEPLTILGAGAALGFGASFKRKLAQKNKQNQANNS